MSDITYVDFRSGIVSERLRRRTDLSVYSNSASLIENAVPLRTGGVIQREGLVQLSSSTTTGTRIIPLSITTEDSYVLVFTPYTEGDTSASNLSIFRVNEEGKVTINSVSFKHTYTEKELGEISYAQTYDTMVIAHKNHRPISITWSKLTDGAYSFSVGDFVLKYARTCYLDGAKTTEYNVSDYSYEDFLDQGNYPSGVSFVANRLVFYNFLKKPYGFWMSKPFEYTDFQETVVYITKTTTLTKSLYLKALELQQSSSSGKGTQTGKSGTQYENCYKKTETTVSTAGYYTTTETIVDEDANVKESYVKTKVYVFSENPKGSDKWTYEDTGRYDYSAVYFAQDTAKTKDVTTDDCAIRLELASDRDETICWLAQSGDYVYVGTTSSEWIIPSGITATSVQCAKLASYGSRENIAIAYGMRNVFYAQTGGKKIRSIQNTGDGIGYTEMTYACPELFEKGIKQMVWQRIPEPRLYVRTVDEPSVLYVLCYDADYSVNAWCKWTFEKEIKSICVVDTSNGQRVVVLYGDYVCIFKDGEYTDFGSEKPFIPMLTTNNIDAYSYMSYGKRIYSIYADTNGTNFSARSISQTGIATSFIQCRSVKGQLSKVEAYTPSVDNQGIRIDIKGKGGEPFTLLALIIDTEVHK